MSEFLYYAKEIGFYICMLAMLCTILTMFTYYVIYPFFIKRRVSISFKESMKALRRKLDTPYGTKFTFIGSSHYAEYMEKVASMYRKNGYIVYLPTFDKDETDSLSLWGANRELIRAADCVCIFWNQRTLGTIFDIGMAFALEKPIRIELLDFNTIASTLMKYSGGFNEPAAENNGHTSSSGE